MHWMRVLGILWVIAGAGWSGGCSAVRVGYFAGAMADMERVVPRVGKGEWYSFHPVANGGPVEVRARFSSPLDRAKILKRYETALRWRGWALKDGWDTFAEGSQERGEHTARAVFGIKRRPWGRHEPEMVAGLVCQLQMYWDDETEAGVTKVNLSVMQDDSWVAFGGKVSGGILGVGEGGLPWVLVALGVGVPVALMW